VQGRYLFADDDTLQAFARDPGAADPAARWVAERALSPGFRRSVEVIATDDVFDRPIFIVSAPRAGSTLLYELLSHSGELWTIDGESHGVIEGVPALHVASRGFDTHRLLEADADHETVVALRAGFLAELKNAEGRRYLERPAAERPARVRLLEKTPENSLRLPFLKAAFPDARFVFLHRDVRQNVSSIVEGWSHGGFVNIPELPGWKRGAWCFLLPPDWRRLNDRSISEVAAFQWAAANDRILDALDTLPRDHWTSVEYAELCAAPEAAVERLLEALGVGPDAAVRAVAAKPLREASTTVSSPSPLKWRSNRLFDESSVARLGPLCGRLRSLASRPTPRATRPRPNLATVPRFACFLEDVPPAIETGGAWIVDPSFQFQLGTTVPLALLQRARCRERFLAEQPLLWVEDPAIGTLQPFWVRRQQTHAFLRLRAGQEPPPGLFEPSLVARLAGAGVLTTGAEIERRRAEGEAMARTSARDLRYERLCVLNRLLHPGHLAALGRYYRELIGGGTWALGDDQVERRHGWHNEPIARFFHHQLTGLVTRIAREPVKPAYCYTSAYRSGAALSAHFDRRQCEYTLSVLVDHSGTPAARPWPLFFQAPSRKVAITLTVGDGVLFRGCELPHWREATQSTFDQTMLLLHYVPADFRGVLD
jgi:LPS sulfotransferase NodH